MPYLLGTDEAGYGPNLGPLLVAATLWRVPDGSLEIDLYDALSDVVTTTACNSSQLAIADSKALYKPGGSWEALERGVFTTLSSVGKSPATWRAMWSATDAVASDVLDGVPWYRDFDMPLPRDANQDGLASLRSMFQNALDGAGVELVAVQCVALFPGLFNALVNELGNKSTVLSQITLDLAQSMTADLPDEPVLIHCDKHGGRNKYGPLLQPRFPDYLIEVREEGRYRSAYQWGPASRRMEARFIAKGESFLPSALASMFAKYLRELAMKAFNQWWGAKIPGLQPTAGYPQDAKRFRAAVDPFRKQEGISDEMFWRVK